MSQDDKFFEGVDALYGDNERNVPQLTPLQLSKLFKLLQIRKGKLMTDEDKAKFNIKLENDTFREKCFQYLSDNDLNRATEEALKRKALRKFAYEEAEL